MLLQDHKEEFERLWYQVEDFVKVLIQSRNNIDFNLILSQETFDGLFTQLYVIAQDAQIGLEFCTNYILKFLSSKSKEVDRDDYASVVMEFLKEQVADFSQ